MKTPRPKNVEWNQLNEASRGKLAWGQADSPDIDVHFGFYNGRLIGTVCLVPVLFRECSRSLAIVTGEAAYETKYLGGLLGLWIDLDEAKAQISQAFESAKSNKII